jgi:ferric-dicitrate binding protein FerR (iron transport regulator)
MSSECRRWIELADLEAAGEPLPPEARSFQRAHVANCAECARETAIWRATRPATPEGPPEAHEVDQVLRGVTEHMQAAKVAARRQVTVLVSAAAFACAAAVALWLRTAPGPVPVAKTDFSSQAIAPVPSARRSGQSEPVTGSVSSSASGAVTAACSQPVPGVTVCVAPETEITHRALDGAERVLELGRGRAVVSLVPQPAGTSFSIATSAGKVTAVGTVFSVEIGADGATVARVIHGRVLVRAKADGFARPLQAGETLRIGAEKPAPLSAPDKERDLALLSLAGESAHADLNEGSPPAASAARGSRPVQQELLEQAQALRARGEFAEAAEVYRKLHAASPQSPSGLAALVSLGELLLSSLNDPQGALNAFDAYLARGGTLAQEAAFGKARALRALKRPQEERRAIERYLATYPDAPQSRVLRHRLTVIAE